MSSFILLRLFSSGHSKEVEALRFREVVLLDKTESDSVMSVGLLACARVARESLMLEGMLDGRVKVRKPRSLLIGGATLPLLVNIIYEPVTNRLGERGYTISKYSWITGLLIHGRSNLVDTTISLTIKQRDWQARLYNREYTEKSEIDV